MVCQFRIMRSFLLGKVVKSSHQFLKSETRYEQVNKCYFALKVIQQLVEFHNKPVWVVKLAYHYPSNTFTVVRRIFG